MKASTTTKSGGGSAKAPSPTPMQSEAVAVPALQRPLTIADLPEAEKARITHLASRLMSLGREHEETMSDLSNERARHATEIDTADRKLGAADDKLVAQSEVICTLQEQRASALSLLQQYQQRLEDYAEEVRAGKRSEQDLAHKARAAEEHVAQLERILDSQRASLEGMEAANETAKAAFKETIDMGEERNRRSQEEASLLREATKKTEHRCQGLENAITSFTRQVANLRSTSAAKDVQIAELLTIVEAHKNTIATLRKEATEQAAASAAAAAAAAAAAVAAATSAAPSSSSRRSKSARAQELPSSGGTSPSRALARGNAAHEVAKEALRGARRFLARTSEPGRKSVESATSTQSQSPSPIRDRRSSFFDASRAGLADSSSIEGAANGHGERRKKKVKKRSSTGSSSYAHAEPPVPHALVAREEPSVRRLGPTERTALRRQPEAPPAPPKAPPGKAPALKARPSTAAPAKASLAVELGEQRQYDASLLFVIDSI